MNKSVALNPPKFTRFAGALGAALFLIGDLLVFGHLGSGSDFRDGAIRAAQSASVGQLYLGGALGPVGACLMLAGVWFLFSRFSSPRSVLANVTAALLVMFCVTVSPVHALWATYGLLVKFCFGQASSCVSALHSVQAYWQVIYLLSIGLGVPGFLLFAWQVAAKRTSFPRWSAVASPLLVFIVGPIGRALPSPVGAVIVACSSSLSLLVFFVVMGCTGSAADDS